MGRTDARVRIVHTAVALAAAGPMLLGAIIAIAGEPLALLVTAIPALLGAGVAALPLLLPARRFHVWVPLAAGLLLVGGVVLLWLGGIGVWLGAFVLLAAVPWQHAWRGVALTVAGIAVAIGLAWGGVEAWNCANPRTTLVVHFHEPPLPDRRDRLLDEPGVSGISWMDPGTKNEIEFEDDAGAQRDRLAEQLRNDRAVASVDARPERCD